METPLFWQLIWRDRELPLDDYDLYEYVLNLLNLVAIAIKVVTYSVCDISQTHNIVIFKKKLVVPFEFNEISEKFSPSVAMLHASIPQLD